MKIAAAGVVRAWAALTVRPVAQRRTRGRRRHELFARLTAAEHERQVPSGSAEGLIDGEQRTT